MGAIGRGTGEREAVDCADRVGGAGAEGPADIGWARPGGVRKRVEWRGKTRRGRRVSR
jgi:hypothetical protein